MTAGFAVCGSGCYVAGKQSVSLGFLDQPLYGCPEKEGRQGPGFADYTASPWSPVAGLVSCNLLPAAFRQQQLPFATFFKSFWYLLLRERVVYTLVGTGGPRDGAETQEKRAHRSRMTWWAPRWEQLAYFTFTFAGAREGRNRIYSGLSTNSKYLFCLIGDSHWNHVN